MFKDYNKYLYTSLKAYLFVLIIIFIMKLVGLDYFGLDVNNPTLIKISNFLSSTHWGDLYYCITIYIQGYFMLCLSTKKTKLYKETLIFTLILYIPQCIMNIFYTMDWIYTLWCTLCLIVVPMIINKKIFIKRQIIFISIMSLYQLISMAIRSVGINCNYNNFLIESLLNIDQLLMLAITHNVYFMKGGSKLCGEEVEAFYSLLKQINLKKLLQKWQRNFQNKKKSKTKIDKVENLTNKIYMILYILWNLFTLICILFIGKLNDTFIECIFIIFSFIISKSVFGKAFHLSNMIHCFIVSNLTYYVLNRITTPLGISILVPIMLGVGLSYFTSKLVKKAYKPLYKGMPKELFEETILKVVDKDSDKYKICYDYFILKKNALYLSGKYCYSEPGIRKIIIRVNEKIKGLK